MEKILDFEIKNIKIYEGKKSTWCPGCGDFGVLTALKQALFELGISPFDTVIVSGIGCSSKLPDYINANAFHTIHGRLLAVATGVKLANQKLNVIVTGGDGDGYGIGGNHLIHAARRNINIKYIVMNNEIYALTKGQVSPTSPYGFVRGTTPYGSKDRPIEPCLLSLSAGATFVARGFSGDIKSLKEYIKAALKHKGFSHIDVLSPCVTYNEEYSYDYFRENIELLDGPYSSREEAISSIINTWKKGKIPVGIFYIEESNHYELSLFGSEDYSIVEEFKKQRELKKEEILELIFDKK
ncbi:MAG: thiamine pyrophosphate-dependent enzyme [Candidatus Hydrothermales bacterium]